MIFFEKKYKAYGTLMALAISVLTFSQELPEKPLIKYIDTDSDSQTITIYWEASATPDIDEYEIYSLANHGSSGVSTKDLLATVCACSLQHTLSMTEAYPLAYTIVASKDEKYSLIGGDYHIPVKLDVTYDSCAAEIELSWSKYVGWKNNFSGYRIFEIDEEGNSSQIQILDTSSVSYSRRNIQENKQYAYRIQAFSNAGYESKSNKCEYFTYMSPPPEFISLDHVTVLDEQSVEIAFSTALNGEIDDFMISRASAAKGAYIPWKTLYDITSETVVEYDYIPTQAGSYYYRIDALNGCGYSVARSNTGSNILLRGESDESTISLNWTEYVDFGTGCDSYNIYRMNISGEYELTDYVSAASFSYNEPISNIDAGEMNGQVKYYIEAIESGYNPLGIKGSSKSNELTVDIETHIFMPNAFTPNGDGQNDIFLPVYDFFPEDFKLMIYDRAGKLIFYSSDPGIGWDGTIGTGGYARAGVFVYHVEYLSFNGRRQVKTGNLTLIYP